MQIDWAHFVALLQNFESNRSKVLTTLTTFFAAVEEGFNKAEQYEALARKSRTASLAALGLSREDLPRFVMFGKTHASTFASTSRSKQLPERKGCDEGSCLQTVIRGIEQPHSASRLTAVGGRTQACDLDHQHIASKP